MTNSENSGIYQVQQQIPQFVPPVLDKNSLSSLCSQPIVGGTGSL